MRLRRTWSIAVALIAIGLCGGVARAESPEQISRRLRALLADFEQARTPQQRREAVRSLAQIRSVRAAERLRKIARSDPDPTVRVEAVRGLGDSPVDAALDLLLSLGTEGGTHEVRRAVGQSIARRSGTAALLGLLGKTKDDLAQGLLVEALAEDDSSDALAALERMARGKDAFLRPTALRALAQHRLGRAVVALVLADVLVEHRDLDTLLAGLDVIGTLDESDLRSLAAVLDTLLAPEVRDAVDAARRRIAWFDAVAAAAVSKKARADGYGAQRDAPTVAPDPPTPRSRVDIVYVFDSSGSVTGYLPRIKERIRRETRTLSSMGMDVRVGLVRYGDSSASAGRAGAQVLPLSYDRTKVEPWIDGGKTRGSDAPVLRGLRPALDRMGWRWGAQRQVALIADAKVGNPKAARALVKLHFVADGTRLRVWYLYRTRTQLPAGLADLADVGGGGAVESLE